MSTVFEERFDWFAGHNPYGWNNTEYNWCQPLASIEHPFSGVPDAQFSASSVIEEAVFTRTLYSAGYDGGEEDSEESETDSDSLSSLRATPRFSFSEMSNEQVAKKWCKKNSSPFYYITKQMENKTLRMIFDNSAELLKCIEDYLVPTAVDYDSRQSIYAKFIDLMHRRIESFSMNVLNQSGTAITTVFTIGRLEFEVYKLV